MKRTILAAIIMAALFPIPSFAYDFSAVNSDGVTIYYNITSKENKTCEVTWNYSMGYTLYSGSIIIPETVAYSSTTYKVTAIGENAFFGCEITSVHIPNSVLTIESFAFESTGITSIDIPNSVTTIEYGAFLGCGLHSIKIPSSVKNIGGAAFYNCCDLKSIVIPKSVKSIGDNPVSVCPNLESILVEEGNPYYDSRDNCNAIIESRTNNLISGCKNTVIPHSVTTIGIYAFYGCKDLKSITIPNSITRIEEDAFCGCSGLTSLTIPSSVTFIGERAFDSCSGLKSVTSCITDVFETTAFDTYLNDIYENTILYVPLGTKTAYQSTPYWNLFKNIIEMDPEIPLEFSCNTKGSVLINNRTTSSGKIETVKVNKDFETSFAFTPDEDCRLEQVTLNDLDITSTVKNNTMSTKVPEGSQMIVTFAKQGADVNGDRRTDINDVVQLVNIILGK